MRIWFQFIGIAIGIAIAIVLSILYLYFHLNVASLYEFDKNPCHSIKIIISIRKFLIDIFF